MLMQIGRREGGAPPPQQQSRRATQRAVNQPIERFPRLASPSCVGPGLDKINIGGARRINPTPIARDAAAARGREEEEEEGYDFNLAPWAVGRRLSSPLLPSLGWNGGHPISDRPLPPPRIGDGTPGRGLQLSRLARGAELSTLLVKSSSSNLRHCRIEWWVEGEWKWRGVVKQERRSVLGWFFGDWYFSTSFSSSYSKLEMEKGMRVFIRETMMIFARLEIEIIEEVGEGNNVVLFSLFCVRV